MTSPVLPRIRSKLLEAIRWASAQQVWESGWPLQASLLQGVPPGEDWRAVNGAAIKEKEAPSVDVHIDTKDEDSPFPKVIPGSHGQSEDEDGYQRGNWRREPFVTVIVATGNSNGEGEPPVCDQGAEVSQAEPEPEPIAAGEAEAPKPLPTEEAFPEPDSSGEEDGPDAEPEPMTVEGMEEAETPLYEVVVEESPAPDVPGVLIATRITRLIPTPPSTGTYGSWERERQPWFTGRWGK